MFMAMISHLLWLIFLSIPPCHKSADYTSNQRVVCFFAPKLFYLQGSLLPLV